MITASIFDNKDSLYKAALRLMLSVVRNSEDEPEALIVPGGRTPVPLFNAAAEQAITPGTSFRLGYTDERHVSETDPQSNYALSLDMISALHLPPDRILRVRTELSLDEAAAEHHEAWQNFFDAGGILRLAFLGLGEDGHTCSLFSPEQLQSYAPGCYAAAVRRETGPDRVTVTPELLARAEHVVFLVTGQGKAAVVDAMLQEPSLVTAAIAVRHAPRVSLWYAPGD